MEQNIERGVYSFSREVNLGDFQRNVLFTPPHWFCCLQAWQLPLIHWTNLPLFSLIAQPKHSPRMGCWQLVLAQNDWPEYMVWLPLPDGTLTIQYRIVILQSSKSNPQYQHSQEFIILTEPCDSKTSHLYFLENCKPRLILLLKQNQA